MDSQGTMGVEPRLDFSIGSPGRFDGDFELSAMATYAPTADERQYLDRLKRLLDRLAKINTEDGLGSERKGLRDQCVQRLRMSADTFLKGAAGTERNQLAVTYLHGSFREEGIYQERLLRIEQAPFVVVPPPAGALATEVTILVRDVRISDEKQRFKVEIDRAQTVVKEAILGSEPHAPPWPISWVVSLPWFARSALRTDPGQKLDKYLRALSGIAAVGLQNMDSSQTPFASLALNGFKEEFVAQEAGIVKNNYVLRLGIFALLAFVASVICYVSALKAPPDSMAYLFRNFFPLIGGAAVGTWLSFSIRRVVLTFGDLANLENDRLSPSLRILFILALTTVVGLLFWTGAVTVVVGDFKTDFHSSGTHAALIGMLCGIAERAMATAVGRRADDFAAGVGGQAKTSA
jgi:hypothetical protein